MSRFESSLKRLQATLRVAPSALSRIDRLGGENAEAIRKANPRPDGWRVASVWIETIPHAASLLLGFGTDIEVIGPEELRREIIDRAGKVHELYCKPARRRRRVGISALTST